jgi:hypothetical protein
MDWQGQAREALVERTTADKATVTLKSDQLREAALIARKGAGDVSAAQRSVLYKVDDAHQAGFVVGEDLSVTDTRTSRNAAELAQRQAQAQAFSGDIRSHAAQLLAADSEVGSKLTATASDVGSLTFDEKPITYNGNRSTSVPIAKTGRSSWSTGSKHQPRHPNLVIQAKTSARRSRTSRRALPPTLLKFAAPKTSRSFGNGRQRTRRHLHPAAHTEAEKARCGDCLTGRSSR